MIRRSPSPAPGGTAIHQRRPLIGLLLSLLVATGCAGTAATPSVTPAGSAPGTSPIAGTSSAAPSAIASIAAATPAASRPAGYLAVAGTHAGLIPPPGFTASATFPGFEHQSGASILVAELPTGYTAMAAGMTNEALAKQGVTATGREEVTIDGRPGLLIVGTQVANGLTFRKQLLLAGTESLTVIVNASDPGDLGDPIRAALLTVGVDTGDIDATAGLQFELAPVAPLTFAGALANAATYNTSGRVPAADPAEPSFVVAPSVGSPGLSPDEATVRTRVGQLPYSNIAIEDVSPITIGGLSGFEATASAAHRTTNEPRALYVVMLFDGGGYVLMTGECREAERSDLFPAFEQTAASYRPKPG